MTSINIAKGIAKKIPQNHTRNPFQYKFQIKRHPEPVDFRKQIDGLVVLVADQLSLAPLNDRPHFIENLLCLLIFAGFRLLNIT
jgi:hypothetical protein